MGGVLNAVRRSGHKLYVLIDEYDHFANRLLSGGADDLYEESIVKRTGFIRTFYAKLKTGTGSGAVGRMFITGVTPLLLDDLSSGFNIISPISQSPRFNTLAGFTRADVERAIDEFVAARPHLAGQQALSDRGRLFDVLEVYYDGYRFSPDATERAFLRELDDRGRYPDDMLDPNVRTEYRHLQRIGTLGGAGAAERRDDLRAALGAMAAEGDIAPFLRVFHVQVLKAFGVKDTRRLDEKILKLLFMVYASLGRAFHPLSEKEFAQGYCDLFLGASKSVPSARFSWLLEFKYLRANAKPAQIEAAFAEAEEQVARYASDGELLPLLLDGHELKAGMIVFVGTKEILFRAWPPAPGAKPPRAKGRAARPRAALPRSRSKA
jgi:hypothetical protein